MRKRTLRERGSKGEPRRRTGPTINPKEEHEKKEEYVRPEKSEEDHEEQNVRIRREEQSEKQNSAQSDTTQ